MVEPYFNPFQGIDVSVPVELHDAFPRYCQTGGSSSIEQSPFPRMVDLWFLAVCTATYLEFEPIDIAKQQTRKIIEGSIFASEPWRIHMLMLIAINKFQDVSIVSEPRRMMALANGLAVAGLPKVIEMLKDGDAEPIWNLSDALDHMLRKHVA
jgi:hypothetical protein